MIDLNISKKVVLVTGAADGIGLKTAEMFAKEGAYVILADINIQRAKNISENMNSMECNTFATEVDIQNRESIEKMISEIISKYSRIDILINNAGIGCFKTMENETMHDWERVLDINLTGVHQCTRAVFKHMKKQKSGRIIMIASLGGQIGGLKVSPGYVASKAGIIGLTKSYARNGAKYGITANAVSPGPTETKMGKGLYSPEITLLNRLAQPEDVAKVVLFLSSSLADYLTGTTIDVNGGALLR
jgi:3-oxoacyl-[acyl-carrier protein] reductase